MTLKLGDAQSKVWSMFEVVDIGPGFDVGAHLHRNAEELFYLLEGQLDLLAFEPGIRTPGNWQDWESHTGARVARGGPGCMMYVPRGCPHAFANPGPGPARMIFLVSPSGHEHYQKELAELVATATGPLDVAIAQLRARHDIEQLTPQVIPGHPKNVGAPVATARSGIRAVAMRGARSVDRYVQWLLCMRPVPRA
jgi:uncharacterized RmlC-like cupin family protein